MLTVYADTVIECIVLGLYNFRLDVEVGNGCFPLAASACYCNFEQLSATELYDCLIHRQILDRHCGNVAVSADFLIGFLDVSFVDFLTVALDKEQITFYHSVLV